MTSVSAFLPRLLVRRHPFRSGCSRYDLATCRRSATSGSLNHQKRKTEAARRRKEAAARGRGAGVEKGKRPPGTPKRTTRPPGHAPLPPVRWDVPKAPHMRAKSTGSGAGGGGKGGPASRVLEYFVENPLIFAGIIFPTLAMGVMVLMKPSLISGERGGNARAVDAAMASQPAVYDSGSEDGFRVKKEGGGVDGGAGSVATGGTPVEARENDVRGREKDVEAFRDTVIVSEEGAASSHGDAGATSKGVNVGEIEGDEEKPAVDLLRTVGIRPHPSDLKEAGAEEGGPAAVDLLYAMGFRPHPSA